MNFFGLIHRDFFGAYAKGVEMAHNGTW